MTLGTDSQPAAPAPAASSAAAPAGGVFRRVYRELTAEEHKLVAEVKDLGEQLHAKFSALNPSRELSIAKTKLEEAVMWAVKHITG